jgi:hypothetical protein
VVAVKHRVFAILGATTAVACGGSAGAPTIVLPQVRNSGGPVLANPTLVPVTFVTDGGDPLVAMVEDFVAKLPGSSFSQLGREYGVESLSAGRPIHTTLDTGAGSLDDSALQKELVSAIEQQQAGFGAVPAEAVYLLFLPPKVVVTALGQTSCVDFGGYHSAVSLSDGTSIAYAVVARCASFNGLDPSDSVTAVASHEILEAATDPYYTLNRGAWANVDSAHLAFELIFGGEIADLCLNSVPVFYTPPDLPYMVQRVWSNAAASAGQDPCVPPPDGGEPFFQVQPELNGSTSLNFDGTAVHTEGIALTQGQSATVTLDLYSAAPTDGPWSLRVVQLSDGLVASSLDHTSGVNGDHVHLTLTLQLPGNFQGEAGLGAIGIESQLGSRKQIWPILITPR